MLTLSEIFMDERSIQGKILNRKQMEKVHLHCARPFACMKNNLSSNAFDSLFLYCLVGIALAQNKSQKNITGI